MHQKPLKIVSVFFLLGFSALACSFGGRAAATPAGDAIATSVAATVNAVATPLPAEPTIPPAAPAAQPQAAPTAAQEQTAGTAAPASPTLPAPVKTALRIVYTDGNNNMWFWEEGGAPRRLVDSKNVQDVHISSDGNLIVFTRQEDPGHYSLCVTGPQGSDIRTLISGADFNAMPTQPGITTVAPAQLEWLPGSHSLLFNTRPVFEGPGWALNNDLWVLNADSGERVNLLPLDKGGSFGISPDGKQLALVTPESISLVNSDGSNRRDGVLKFTFVSTYSEYAYYPEPRWSPDSKFLRVVIPPAESLNIPTPPTTIWNIPQDGSSAAQAGSIVTAPLMWAKISPDLQKVAYLAQVGDASLNQRELRVASAEGSNLASYQKGQLALESWAPDSSHFIFTDQEKRTTYIQQPGGDAVSLVDGKAVERLHWVDNNRFLALVRVSSGWELHLGIIGGDRTRIASLEQGDGSGYPAFESNLMIP